MAPHTITPAVGAVCRCKAKTGLRRSPKALHITNTIVITAEIESGFVAKEDLVPFRCSPVSSCTRRLRMVRENTGAPSEGATCAWMAADEAVGCARAFRMILRSSRRLVCQGHPEPGLRINDISQIH
ncbi:uncharacterized protein TNCV_4426331 [Trichonephila clavipes]|nr:uncharacterized protein TNCV_4426331 [Trichonephila clavipes]